jgi:hypothetical protein
MLQLLLIKYFAASACELFARVQLVMLKTAVGRSCAKMGGSNIPKKVYCESVYTIAEAC